MFLLNVGIDTDRTVSTLSYCKALRNSVRERRLTSLDIQWEYTFVNLEYGRLSETDEAM
jgi:hypothetical protein